MRCMVLRKGSSRKVTKYCNYINGEWVTPSTSEYYDVINPADHSDIIGQFPLSAKEDADKAVLCAHEAFPAWSRLLPSQRAEYVYKFIELLEKEVDNIGKDLCREQGKPLGEAIGEPSRSIKECRYIVGEATRLAGINLPSERPNVVNNVVREPIGVIAAITPWNFPFLTPVRKVIPALIAGCTVVLKPANSTPLCSVRLAELLEKAKVPKGVVNLVIGKGSTLGDALTANPLVSGVTFTGSTNVGRHINKSASEHFAKVQLEMGGKNPALVAGFKDLDFAAEQIVTAAFANAGQRCTAISRVIVTYDQADELEQIIVEKAKKLVVGPGMESTTNIGPVIDDSAGRDILGHIEEAEKAGAVVSLGGNRLTGGSYDKGFYIEPTVITNVKPDMKIAVEEVFGPVLAIIRVTDFKQGLSVVNQTPYGLAAAVFSDIQENIYAFMNGAQSGMVHINHGTVSESFMPFGGVKMSGLGPFSIGTTNKDFFTNYKVVYTQY